MQYMLDTNICIFLIRMKSVPVLRELRKHDPAVLCISAVTIAELEYGCDLSADPVGNRLALTEFLSPFVILPFDTAAARVYGTVRAGLEKEGKPIGAMDLLIAAHALSKQLTLVTNNTREFKRVANLKVVDWHR